MTPILRKIVRQEQAINLSSQGNYLLHDGSSASFDQQSVSRFLSPPVANHWLPISPDLKPIELDWFIV